MEARCHKSILIAPLSLSFRFPAFHTNHPSLNPDPGANLLKQCGAKKCKERERKMGQTTPDPVLLWLSRAWRNFRVKPCLNWFLSPMAYKSAEKSKPSQINDFIQALWMCERTMRHMQNFTTYEDLFPSPFPCLLVKVEWDMCYLETLALKDQPTPQ